MPMRIACHAAAALFLGACAQVSPPPQTANQVLAASTIRDSAFDTARIVSTPPIVSKHQRGGGLYVFTDTAKTTIAVSQKKDTGTVIFLLTTTVEYGDRWRFYRTVSLIGGVTLVERAANRQVQSCRGVECEFFESVVFELPPAIVRKASDTGLALRLNADVGPSLELSLPPQFIAAANTIADTMLGVTGGRKHGDTGQ